MKKSVLWLPVLVALGLGVRAFGQPAPPPTPPVPPTPQVRVFGLPGQGGSYLGIGVAEIDADRAKALNLTEVRGVEVTRVEPDSPAETAGVKEGDVVLEYNSVRVEGVEQFMRLVRETPPGRTVKLLVSRNGATQELTGTLGTRKSRAAAVLGPEFRREMDRLQEELGRMRWQVDMPQPFMAWRTAMLGIEAEGLSPQLAEFFGVKEGVLVRSVVKDSPAEKAGLRAGDVITRVDETSVRTPSDVTARVKSIEAGRAFPLTVVRDRQEMVLNVTVEEPAPSRRSRERIEQQKRVVPRGRTVGVAPTPFL